MPRQPSRNEPALTRTILPRPAYAKAPGKIILTGEQFVVLGAPAVAMAINLYSRAEAKPNGSDKVQIGVDIPMRSVSTSNVRRRVGNSQGFLRPLRLAAEATLDHIGEPRKGVDLNVACEIPIAAGLGSSASTTVAIISAVARSLGVELTRKVIFELAFIPE